MSDRGSVSAGFGLIEVDAVASIDFEISYGEISHDWFIQPFYLTELMLSRPYQAIERSSSGERIRVRLWAEGRVALFPNLDRMPALLH